MAIELEMKITATAKWWLWPALALARGLLRSGAWLMELVANRGYVVHINGKQT